MNSGKTAFQKIVESHCRGILPDGSWVLGLDWVWCHEITTPNAIIDATSRNCDEVFDPNKVKTMIDHVNPAKDTASAIQGQLVREWSKKHKIEFLEVGRNGICHRMIPEKGWIRPGQIGIMGDSHTCTHGAFCALTAGVGTTELEAGIITGLWVCPPQKVIRVNFNGTLPANVYAKDLILSLIKQIGVKGATNAVLEFGGPVIDEMSMDARLTITNMAVEAGATSGMMMVDETTIKALHPDDQQLDEIGGNCWETWNSDPDAEYDQVINIDVSKMVPVITINYSPEEVVPVQELIGKQIQQVYIGSCTDGSLESLRIAAKVFQHTQDVVAPEVRCIVVPATQLIYEKLLQEGAIEIFLKAGCFVSGPTCGACLGMSCGVLAPGEVCVSTTNRNFPGRMGKGGMVHLASPAVAVMSAIAGVIAEPTPAFCAIIEAEIAVLRASDCRLDKSIGRKKIHYQKPDYVKLAELFHDGTNEEFSGKVVYLLEKNVDTDQIIPAKYLTETDKAIFGKHCLEDASMSDRTRANIFTSQILVTGENFGCGSSREHAPWALESAGIRCVIAPSFARIFENNMFANGLLCITLPKEKIDKILTACPSEIQIFWQGGVLKYDNQTEEFGVSDYRKDLLRSGGGVGYMIKLAAQLQQEAENS